jgi:uncharacterized protein involved in exopolysaccharide biosynthesis
VSGSRDSRDGGSVDTISLLEVWRIIRADWQVLAACVVAFAIAAVAAALMMTPVYRAQAVVVPVDPAERDASASALLSQLGTLAGVAGVNLGGLTTGSSKGRVTIQSRSLIEEFIRRNRLEPVLFEGGRDPRTGGEPTLWRAVEEFKRWFSAEIDPETGLITVRVEWTDPVRAAAWANGLVDLANELLREHDLADSQRNIKYLNEQLAKTNAVGLQQVLYNLIEVELRTLMLVNGRREYALATIDRAVAPEMRHRPKRKQIAVLGTVLGVIVGLGLIALRHALRGASARSPAAGSRTHAA